MRLKADATLFFIAFIWGTSFVAQRVAGNLGTVYYFNAARYLLAALVVLPFALRASRIENIEENKGQKRVWMIVAGFLLFIAAAFQQSGMLYTTAGNAGFITSLYVVIVPILIWIGWRERPHWLSIFAVGLAGVGAYLLSTSGRFEVQKGDTLELAGALFWALHVVVLGKFANKFEPLSFSAGQLFICGLMNLLVGFAAERPVIAISLVGAVLYTAIMAIGLCYTLQVWAQRHTPPSDAALILSLESVFAVLAGWILINEQLVGIQILGCVLIFIAVGLSQVKGLQSDMLDLESTVEGR